MGSVEVDGAAPHIETRTASGSAVTGGLLSATAYERLKPGPGQSPEQVKASQRTRIHRAMVELTAAVGYEHVTVRALTRMAGVSSRSFYGQFTNREECLASTADSVGCELLRAAARRAVDGGGWKDQLRASLDGLFMGLADRPKAARLLLLEVHAAGWPTRTRAAELTANLETLVAHLLVRGDVAPAPPDLLVAGIAAGITRIATATTLTGRSDELRSLSGEVADWAIDIYDERRVALCATSDSTIHGSRREPGPLPAELSVVDSYGEDERILSAAIKLAIRTGFGDLTVSKIRREAGVSRRSFDARFGDVVECFLNAIESLALGAVRRAARWAASVDDAQPEYRMVLALCAMAARNEAQARLVLATIVHPGRRGLERRERLISDTAGQLASSDRPDVPVSLIRAEATVAAMWRIAQKEVVAGRASRLPRSALLLASLAAAGSSASAVI